MLELKNVCKNYKEIKALDNVNLLINKGDYVSVTGNSGSGKSTLLFVMSMLESIDEGKIYFNGVDYASMKEKECARLRNKHFGFVFQAFNLENNYSVYENVEIPLLISGTNKNKIRKTVAEKLKMVGMYDRINSKAAALSGGEKQRVAIARALATNPEIIFADEPCGNLDTLNSGKIMDIFRSLNEQGTTIVLVTHNLIDARQANKQYFMSDGKLIKTE